MKWSAGTSPMHATVTVVPTLEQLLPVNPVTLGGKRNVGITELEQVGNYAVRVIFDDGHSTGIYAWATLRRWWDAGKEGGLVTDPTPELDR